MVIAGVGIDVHGDTRIGVTHQVLQTFQVHTGVCHVGAEGMPEYMGCDLRQRLIRMQLLVFLQRPLEVMLNVHGDLGIPILVQQQKPRVSVDDPFLGGFLPVRNDVLQCCHHIVGHGNITATAFGFRLFHIVGVIRLADKLM